LHASLAKTGDTAKGCTLLAEVYHELGEEELAADAKRRAARQTEPFGWPDPYLERMHAHQTGLTGLGRRATQLLKAGRGEEGQKILEELVRRYPDSAKARAGLGRMYVLRNLPAEAEVHLREALRLDPSNNEARYHLATSLLRQKKLTEAVTVFRRVVEAEPDQADAHLKLAECLHRLGDKEAAVRSVAEAVRFEPNNFLAQKNLGVVLVELKRYQEAIKPLELADALKPNDPQVTSVLARARALAEATKK
jgi:tetratricopeptide (TPR) repeat protein